MDTTKVEVWVLPSSGTKGYRVHLAWANVRNAAEYEVVYEVWRRGPGGCSTKIGEASPTIADGKVVNPVTYVDAEVQLDTTYFYKIRAKSGRYADLSCPNCGPGFLPGGFSREVTVFVTCNPLPPELKTVTYDPGTNTVTLSWTNP